MKQIPHPEAAPVRKQNILRGMPLKIQVFIVFMWVGILAWDLSEPQQSGPLIKPLPTRIVKIPRAFLE